MAHCKSLAFLVEDQGSLITEHAVAVEAEDYVLLLCPTRRRKLMQLQEVLTPRQQQVALPSGTSAAAPEEVMLLITPHTFCADLRLRTIAPLALLCPVDLQRQGLSLLSGAQRSVLRQPGYALQSPLR